MDKIAKLMFTLVMLLGIAVPQAQAGTRMVVRDKLGLSTLKIRCLLLGCNVLGGLGDPQGQVFLVINKDGIDPLRVLFGLLGQLGIVNVEMDQVGKIHSTSDQVIPNALYDRTLVDFYGTTVWRGYVNQLPTQLIRSGETRARFGVTGEGIVAVIDTGIDPSHPAFRNVLVPGYDFTRNSNGGNEKGDVNQSTVAVLDAAQAAYVNQSTVAVLDQSTVAVLDSDRYAAFGHGTMVAGVVHLVAPTAKIMPLKAFQADGTGYVSDVMRAIYYAQKNGAKVINMSFSFAAPSRELENALSSVTSKGVIAVASAGNDGKQTLVYPAAYGTVIGVASTDDFDHRSSFSNYGPKLVWIAAPGEGIVTTYPFGTYAATWGTSFSTPFVAGAAALLVDVSSTANASNARLNLGHADYIDADLNKGRLNTYTAVESWRQTLRIP